MKQIITYIFLILLTNSLFGFEKLSEDSKYIDVYFDKVDTGGYNFYADNRHFIPQTINLGFISLKNLKMDRDNPSITVLKPGDKKILIATLTPINKGKSYSFRSILSHVDGGALDIKPDDYLYTFPFEHGSKFRLDQGYGGSFSHRGENFYALDFTMDVGTPICAARGGVITDVKEDSNRGGPSASYAKYGNYITIYHSDGTFANYVHLKQNGAIVEVGNIVKAGDVIGYSGKTGLATGPHLHFSVSIPTKSGKRESIPTEFAGTDGKPVELIVGNYYYSNHVGGKPFVVTYGKDLTNANFANYRKDVPKTNKLHFRNESFDNTTVLYCVNGYDNVVNGKISFNLRNSVVSVDTPINIDIPPLSEVYLCLVNPRNREKPFSFSYSISYSVQE